MCTTKAKPAAANATHSCPKRKPRSRLASRKTRRTTSETTRQYIGLAIVGLAATVAIIGIWVPAASNTFEKLLPSLALMCGYYFGQLQA